jgi:hypothetical protein
MPSSQRSPECFGRLAERIERKQNLPDGVHKRFGARTDGIAYPEELAEAAHLQSKSRQTKGYRQ